jgi:hypothetical protein
VVQQNGSNSFTQTKLIQRTTGPCKEEAPVIPHIVLNGGMQLPDVREVQRKLVVFNDNEIKAGKAPLPDMPLVDDCMFGSKTYAAVVEFQKRVFPGDKKEWDGIVGDKTWAEIDKVVPATPPPKPVDPPKEELKPCPDPDEPMIDSYCVSDKSKENPPDCKLGPKHKLIIGKGYAEALQRVNTAIYRINVKPYGEDLARSDAATIFTDRVPGIKEMKDYFYGLKAVLEDGKIFFAGQTCSSEDCNSKPVAAWVAGKGVMPVYFCPRSFEPSIRPEMRRTIIHESTHLIGIDVDESVEENYCMKKGCFTSCQSTQSADAWTQFVDCYGERP